MEILFILSEVMLILSIILKEKTKKEIDIIGFACMSIVLLFCYNTFVCYILTFLTIPIKLWILIITNLIFSILLFIDIFKNKRIQRYVFNKTDLIYIFIIIGIVISLAYIFFGFPFNINYTSADASHHYLTSVKFAKEETLMPNAEEDMVYGDLSARKPLSYVNSGLLMKCFCKNLDSIECYNVFVAFGIFTLILIGITLYSSLKKYAKNKEHTFWAFLIAIICTIGYPLNSFLFGFEYLTMGLLILCAIIDMVYYFDNEVLKLTYITLMFALLNFGLFCSYYMFVPFVYPALWIYFCIKNYQKTKKLITKEVMALCVIGLLIPFILGFIYCIEPNMYAIFIKDSANIGGEYSAHLVNSALAVNGFIYINLYSNMLLLLPLTIYLFIVDAKENKLKKEGFLALLLILIIAFIELLLIGNAFGKVSTYYLSKNYFALWVVLAFTNYKALILLSEKKKFLPRIFIGLYIFIAIVYTCFSDVRIVETTKNENENIFSVMEIFGANKTILRYKKEEFNQKELEIISYAKENLDFSKRIEVVSEHKAYYWFYALVGYTDRDELYQQRKILGQKLLEIKCYNVDNKIKEKKLDYVIYFNKSGRYKDLENKIFKNAEVIYKNEAGGIVKYKN